MAVLQFLVLFRRGKHVDEQLARCGKKRTKTTPPKFLEVFLLMQGSRCRFKTLDQSFVELLITTMVQKVLGLWDPFQILPKNGI